MLGEWLENNLQDPFFRAEMVKVQVNVVEGAERNLASIKAMAVFGTVYMTFCAYWFAKCIAD